MKLNYFLGFIILLISSTTLADSNTHCSTMLKQSAHTWANQKSSTPDIEDAIAQYGNCVDQDTQQLYTKMLKTGNYPLMGANGDFQDFSTALNNFTDLALKANTTSGTYDRIQYAYAKLYQKQFKLLFYADYINNTKDPLILRLKKNPQPNLKELNAYFNQILLNYPPAKRKALLTAFTQMTTQSMFGEMHQPYIYRYAIFILEPPSGKVFPEPF